MDLTNKYPERNAELVCSHCGSFTDNKNSVFKNDKVFCCNGCCTIFELIYSLGLQDYYSLRNSEKHGLYRSSDYSTEESEDFSYLRQKNFKKLYTSEQAPDIMNFYIEGRDHTYRKAIEATAEFMSQEDLENLRRNALRTLPPHDDEIVAVLFHQGEGGPQ